MDRFGGRGCLIAQLLQCHNVAEFASYDFTSLASKAESGAVNILWVDRTCSAQPRWLAFWSGHLLSGPTLPRCLTANRRNCNGQASILVRTSATLGLPIPR